jgi:hypothetical protein
VHLVAERGCSGAYQRILAHRLARGQCAQHNVPPAQREAARPHEQEGGQRGAGSGSAGEGAAEDRNGDGDNVGDGSDVGDNGGNNADNGVDDCEAIEAAAPVGPALSAASVDSSDEMPVYFGAGASMRTE